VGGLPLAGAAKCERSRDERGARKKNVCGVHRGEEVTAPGRTQNIAPPTR
jgi:hypothetical protein